MMTDTKQPAADDATEMTMPEVATEAFLPALFLVAARTPGQHAFWASFFLLTRQNLRAPLWSRFPGKLPIPRFQRKEKALGWLQELSGEHKFEVEHPGWNKRSGWGGLFWSLMFAVAAMADEPEFHELFRGWVASLPMVLPCPECKKDFVALLKKENVRHYLDQKTNRPVGWVIRIKNAIETRLRGAKWRDLPMIRQQDDPVTFAHNHQLLLAVPLADLHPRPARARVSHDPRSLNKQPPTKRKVMGRSVSKQQQQQQQQQNRRRVLMQRKKKEQQKQIQRNVFSRGRFLVKKQSNSVAHRRAKQAKQAKQVKQARNTKQAKQSTQAKQGKKKVQSSVKARARQIVVSAMPRNTRKTAHSAKPGPFRRSSCGCG